MARRPPRSSSPSGVHPPAVPGSAAPGGPAGGATAPAGSDDAVLEDRREQYRRASGSFRSRDFRKPQLAAGLDDPMADQDRRRSSAQRPAVLLDPTELYEASRSGVVTGGAASAGGAARAPTAAPPPRVVQGGSQPARRAGAQGPSGRGRAGAARDGADAPAAPSAEGAQHDGGAARRDASARGLRPAGPVPWAALALIAALALGATLLLPLVAEGPMLWKLLGEPTLAPWPLGGRITAGVVVLALVALVVSASQGALRAGLGESALPNAALMGSGLLAAGHLVFRAAAAPGGLNAPLAPLRGDLGGVPDAVWLGLAAGGLLAVTERQSQRMARTVALIGGLGLALAWWTPLGFAGQSFVPLLTALSGTAAPAEGALQLAAWVDAPGAVILGSFTPLLVLVPLLWPRALPPLVMRGLAAACVAVVPAVAALSSGDGTLVVAGGALATGATALLVAASVGLTLDRLTTRWDDEALMTLEILAVVLVVGVWTIAKINGMRYSATDEGVYFYAAKAWASGLWPYHDFFFSHPPLHILIPAVFFAIFGFSVTVAKSISVAAAGIAGLFIWRTGRRWFDPLTGVVAMTLFLFAGEVMKSSTNLTGINLTTMWACAGLWAALRRKSFLAGALLGAAACTGFYSVGYFLTLTVLALLAPDLDPDKNRPMVDRVLGQPGVQLLLGFAVVFGAVNLVFFLLAGEDYLTGVYRYHFLKRAKLAGFTPLDEGLHALPQNLALMLGGRDFRVSLYYHGAHYVLAFLAPLSLVATVAIRRHAQKATPHLFHAPKGLPPHLADKGRWAMLWDPRLWWTHPKSGGALALVTVLLWAMLTEFAQFKERYDFYYTLVLPLLSLLAAAWLHGLVRLGRWAAGCGARWRRPAEGPEARGLFQPAPKAAAPIFAAALALTLLWVPVNIWANATAWPSEVTPRGSSKGRGEVLKFDWIDAPGPSFVSETTRALLWKGHRVRGSLESGLHHYLWSKKRWFSTAEPIAAYIREHSKSEETVTGSSTHAPMVALLAKRRMAGDHVDTNSKTFKTGVVSRKAFWTKACKDNVRFIVAGPRSYFSPASMPRRPTVVRHFRLVKEFRDPALKHWRSVTLQLWERKHSPDKHRCTYEGPQRGVRVRRK